MVLNYQEQGDFSAINTLWQLDSESYQQLTGKIPTINYQEHRYIVNQTYTSQVEFQSVLSHFPTPLDQNATHLICEAANLGEKSFQQNFGWIE